MTTTVPYAGQICSCGRPALAAFATDEFGSVGYCGIPGRSPLNPHNCDLIPTVHDADYCAQLAVNLPNRGRTTNMTEDPRIGIIRGAAREDPPTDEIVVLLAELDAAAKPIEPLGDHSEHLFDDRCAECVPQGV